MIISHCTVQAVHSLDPSQYLSVTGDMILVLWRLRALGGYIRPERSGLTQSALYVGGYAFWTLGLRSVQTSVFFMMLLYQNSSAWGLVNMLFFVDSCLAHWWMCFPCGRPWLYYSKLCQQYRPKVHTQPELQPSSPPVCFGMKQLKLPQKVRDSSEQWGHVSKSTSQLIVGTS